MLLWCLFVYEHQFWGDSVRLSIGTAENLCHADMSMEIPRVWAWAGTSPLDSSYFTRHQS